MHHIYKQAIGAEVARALNQAVDAASEGGSFEILIPPQSTNVLEEFKEPLLRACPEIDWRDDSYVVIRSVTDKGNRAAQCWHFDNLRKTALIVLASTDGAENGDILMRSNLRASPKSLFWYAATKLFWTNPLTWLILRIPAVRNRFFTRVPLIAGDVMVFDGSTAYHGNLPISQGMRRSILVHNDQLFPNSIITRIFHQLNKLYLYKT